MRGLKTDITSRHHILRYVLITQLYLSVEDINRLTEREINTLLTIHYEVLKMKEEKEKEVARNAR